MSSKRTILLTSDNEHWYDDVNEVLVRNENDFDKNAITLEFSKENIRIEQNDSENLVITITNADCDIYKVFEKMVNSMLQHNLMPSIPYDSNDFLKLVSSWRGTGKSIKRIRKTADEIEAALDELISYQPEELLVNIRKAGYVIVISTYDYYTLVREKYLYEIDNYKGFKLTHKPALLLDTYIITSPNNI